MAESTKIERIYTVPLRQEWMKVPRYKRARKGVVALKEFIARHMKVPERDVDNVKLDVYLNNQMWHRGTDKSPSKIRVKATKEGNIVHVTFADMPKHVEFAKAKHVRKHPKSEAKSEKVEEKKELQTEEEKKVEQEKEKSVAIAKEHVAEQDKKAKKHTTKASTPEIHRMALKK